MQQEEIRTNQCDLCNSQLLTRYRGGGHDSSSSTTIGFSRAGAPGLPTLSHRAARGERPPLTDKCHQYSHQQPIFLRLRTTNCPLTLRTYTFTLQPRECPDLTAEILNINYCCEKSFTELYRQHVLLTTPNDRNQKR